MVVTPMGAERHYTRTYSEFVQLLREDPVFAEWLQPVEADLVKLLTGTSWMGASVFPLHRCGWLGGGGGWGGRGVGVGVSGWGGGVGAAARGLWVCVYGSLCTCGGVWKIGTSAVCIKPAVGCRAAAALPGPQLPCYYPDHLLLLDTSPCSPPACGHVRGLP
jgi:hypothetical protein